MWHEFWMSASSVHTLLNSKLHLLDSQRLNRSCAEVQCHNWPRKLLRSSISVYLWVLHVVPFSGESHLPEYLVSSEHALTLSAQYKSAGTRQTIAHSATSSAYSLYVGRTKYLERFNKMDQMSYLICSETLCWVVSATLFVTTLLVTAVMFTCLTQDILYEGDYGEYEANLKGLPVNTFYIACPVMVEMISINASGFTVNSPIYRMSTPNNCICCEDCLYINKHSAGVEKKKKSH